MATFFAFEVMMSECVVTLCYEYTQFYDHLADLMLLFFPVHN